MSNPFLENWNTPHQSPPFDSIKIEHYVPAFNEALAAHNKEIDHIASNPEAPTYENVIDALELSGELLEKVASVFFNLTGSNTNDELEAIQREMSPRLSKHYSAIMLNQDLFKRVATIEKEKDTLNLTTEQRRVLDRIYTGFVRSGAALDEAGRLRIAEIAERLAILGTRFSQNVLADEKSWELVLENEDDLDGLPDFLRDAAAQTAKDRGHDGKWVITTSRSLIEPFLQFSNRRDLRETAFKAWAARGENGGDTDNRELVVETVQLRAERANLLGFETFAEFKLDDRMAKTTENVRELLHTVWAPAAEQAGQERKTLEELARSKGANISIQPWDWRYYSEQVRARDHAINEAEIKPYFPLEKMIEASFDTATRLFGLGFKERFDIPKYHPDVRTFDVFDAAGDLKAVFIADYFARASKRSGAWMSAFRGQQRLKGEIIPIIVNVMNFAKGGEDAPSLLTFDDARTLFHEFGHALHGMLSNVTYPRVAGTGVAQDFVELPSQLYEHWLFEPEVLEKYAVHYKTGEPLPKALLEKILAAKNFNQGFATVEYLASAIVDMEIHSLKDPSALDVGAFEKEILGQIKMPEAMIMRHRIPHFQHCFSGDHYSAGYYSYMWSEVMDADAFDAFKEAGNIFDHETAKKLHDHIYSAGGSKEPELLYTAFRGRMPTVDALLKKRGFAQ